jgi:hypothetical protein
MLTITTDDATLLDDLCRHFDRSGFTVRRLPRGGAEVSMPDAPTAAQSAREVQLHLAVWRVMNPRATSVAARYPHADDVATDR